MILIYYSAGLEGTIYRTSLNFMGKNHGQNHGFPVEFSVRSMSDESIPLMGGDLAGGI
jgi:hypothetical protein